MQVHPRHPAGGRAAAARLPQPALAGAAVGVPGSRHGLAGGCRLNPNAAGWAASALVAALALWAGSTSAADVFDGQAYLTAGATESISATFGQADGGVSRHLYSGLVRLVVSGTGKSLDIRDNDAFHVFNDGLQAAPYAYHQLTIDDAPLRAFNPLQEAKYFVVFDVDAGTPVRGRPYVPAYRADHTYTFVVDLGLLGVVGASRLHFGVSDGNFADNAGRFDIEITPLTTQAAVPVPEPATYLLGACGGLGLLASRRSRRQPR